MKIFLKISILYLLLLLSSCTKDETDNTENIRLDEITTGSWKITSYNFNSIEYPDSITKYFGDARYRFELASGSLNNMDLLIIPLQADTLNLIGNLAFNNQALSGYFYLYMQSEYLAAKYYPNKVVPDYAPLMLKNNLWQYYTRNGNEMVFQAASLDQVIMVFTQE